jgi:hypothetical protein
MARGSNGSPSTVSNWRRITRSSVVWFPSISIRSTKTRGPRVIAKLHIQRQVGIVARHARLDPDESAGPVAWQGFPSG